jgi:iron(III) transport system permease protein
MSVMGPRGLLQNLLRPLGVERLAEMYGLGGAALTMTLINYPFVVLNVRAALARLDPSLEEVARSLGDRPLRAFFRVTLPHLRPSITSGGLLVSLYALGDFGTPSLMGFNTFTRAIYMQYRSSFNRSGAALLSLMLVVLTLLILTVEVLSRGRGRFHRVAPGTERPPTDFELGRLRLPALLFCSALVLLALVLPVSAICYWLVVGLVNGGSLNLRLSEVSNSVVAASWAAVATVVAALPITLLSVRYQGPLSRLLDRTAYVGGALPGIAIALSLVFFGANYAPFIYQTLSMLIFAYVVRFLPQALGGIRSSLLQVSPRLEEAAQSLGRSRRSVLFTITLPLLMPGILWGGSMVFLTAIKELPLTLMLGPTGFGTLSTRIWHATSEGLFSQAAPPALLLLLVSGLSMILVLRGERGRRNG